jgi:hypothetical protein
MQRALQIEIEKNNLLDSQTYEQVYKEREKAAIKD